MTDDLAGELLRAALDHAARGWPVFPLRPGSKAPALHGTEDCPRTGECTDGHRKWEDRATLDPQRITTTWQRRPFNIGLPPGRAGLVVIDLDTPKPGEAAPPEWARFDISCGADVLAALAEQTGLPTTEALPATYAVATPSGGRHLYYEAPAGTELRNTTGDRGNGLGWLIDTRAHGGYVVAAGSITPAGPYRVLDDRAPVPLPGWLVARLRPPALPAAPAGPIRTGVGRRARYLDAAKNAETARVINAPPRGRNFALYCAAKALGELVAGGALAEHEAYAVLIDAASRHIAIGAYSHRQADQTIASGFRAGARTAPPDRGRRVNQISDFRPSRTAREARRSGLLHPTWPCAGPPAGLPTTRLPDKSPPNRPSLSSAPAHHPNPLARVHHSGSQGSLYRPPRPPIRPEVTT